MKGYDKIYLMNAALAFPVSLDHFLILTMFITSVGYVTMNVEKNLPQEEAQQFPTTIAVNAFRGFLDEYQKRPKKKRPKPKPQKQQAQKANQKKKAKEVSALVYREISVIISRPTMGLYSPWFNLYFCTSLFVFEPQLVTPVTPIINCFEDLATSSSW